MIDYLDVDTAKLLEAIKPAFTQAFWSNEDFDAIFEFLSNIPIGTEGENTIGFSKITESLWFEVVLKVQRDWMNQNSAFPRIKQLIMFLNKRFTHPAFENLVCIFSGLKTPERSLSKDDNTIIEYLVKSVETILHATVNGSKPHQNLLILQSSLKNLSTSTTHVHKYDQVHQKSVFPVSPAPKTSRLVQRVMKTESEST